MIIVIIKGVQKDVKKAEELQGPTKIRKVTLKDFKRFSRCSEDSIEPHGLAYSACLLGIRRLFALELDVSKG